MSRLMTRILRTCASAVSVAAAASIALPDVVSAARKPVVEAARSEQAIKPRRDCSAAIDQPEGLKQSLVAHADSLIGFKYKMRAGAYLVPKTARNHLADLPSATLLGIISDRLRELDGYPPRHVRTAYAPSRASARTKALIYDIGNHAGRKSVCVWLIGYDGIEAAETVALPDVPLAASLRSSIGVTARASSRSPIAKGRQKAASPATTKPRAADAAGQETDAGPQLSLAAIAEFVLPGSVRAKLLPAPAVDRAMLVSAPNRLLILPASDIGSLPFAALPLDGKPLITFAAIVILSDIDALMAHVVDNPPLPTLKRPEETLIVGDPDLSGDPRYTFSPLPAARREATDVAQLLSSNALTGPMATRHRIAKALEGSPSIIYFATHGISDPVNPMDGSFLALKDGHLFGRDIKKLRERSPTGEYNPLVVMSACQTGLGKVFEGGVFGLARAWHHAGAWQVVMSLWNVSDEATMDLMVRFAAGYSNSLRDSAGRRHRSWRKESRGPPSSPDAPKGAEFDLRQAILATRDVHSDPALWAGFVLFGLPTKQ